MSRFGLTIELDVDRSSVADLSAIAFDWLDGLTHRLADQQVRGLPTSAPASVGGRRPLGAPLGPPGSLWGATTVTRFDSTHPPRIAERAYSTEAMRWLRAQLTELPRWADVEFGYLDERGHRGARLLDLRAEHRQHAPDWIRLFAFVPEKDFLDQATGRSCQRTWLEALRSFADELNPGFGQITYAYHDGATALEDCLPAREYPPQHRLPEHTLNHCRQVLRGYSWLTILPAQLVDRLGGAQTVISSGVFAEAIPLRNGGMWLLATDDYRDYTDETVDNVFHALAPVLRRGRPVPQPQMPGEPPHRLVFQDAATASNPG